MTDIHAQHGTLGATRISWSKGARRLLRDIMEGDATASEEIVLKRFAEQVKMDDAVLDEVIQYFVTNHYRYLADSESALFERRKAREMKRQARKEYVKAQAQKAAEAISEIMLLGQTMPNGKLRGKCTRSELLQFSTFDRTLAGRLQNDHDALESVVNENEAHRILNEILKKPE